MTTRRALGGREESAPQGVGDSLATGAEELKKRSKCLADTGYGTTMMRWKDVAIINASATSAAATPPLVPSAIPPADALLPRPLARPLRSQGRLGQLHCSLRRLVQVSRALLLLQVPRVLVVLAVREQRRNDIRTRAARIGAPSTITAIAASAEPCPFARPATKDETDTPSRTLSGVFGRGAL